MTKTPRCECYEIAQQLRNSDTATTEDGWKVSYAGTKSPHTQTVRACKENKEVILRHYKGSEGVARVLIKARMPAAT